MRKVVSGLVIVLFSFPIWAQGNKSPLSLLRKKEPLQTLQGTSKLKNINVSRQLDKRLKQSFEQARQAQAQLPAGYSVNVGEPINRIYGTWGMDPKRIYPQHTFLKNTKQTAKFFAARSNRLLLQELRRMQGVWAKIDENIDRLRAEAAATPQPQNPVPWLADALPPKTTHFFVGETHLEGDEIHSSVADLLHEVRARQPEREIILFTEFLPEDLKWTGRRPSISQVPEFAQKYFFIWDKALEEKIKVIGLEEAEIEDDYCRVNYQTANGEKGDMTAWGSLEGVRLRNARWQQTLARYRAEHPHALFIIYTGWAHSMYTAPFTLSANPNERPFVAVFSADFFNTRSNGRYVDEHTRGPLERIKDGLDLGRAIVKWQSPDLPQVAGFDVRIKVQVQRSQAD